METDRVLTMDEYLDYCCVATKHVNPPASDARHIAITAGEHDCRCARWGHPRSGCDKFRHEVEQKVSGFGGATNKR